MNRLQKDLLNSATITLEKAYDRISSYLSVDRELWKMRYYQAGNKLPDVEVNELYRGMFDHEDEVEYIRYTNALYLLREIEEVYAYKKECNMYEKVKNGGSLGPTSQTKRYIVQ